MNTVFKPYESDPLYPHWLTVEWPEKPQNKDYPFDERGTRDYADALIEYNEAAEDALTSAVPFCKENKSDIFQLWKAKYYTKEVIKENTPYYLDINIEVSEVKCYHTSVLDVSEGCPDCNGTGKSEFAFLVEKKVNSAHSFTEGSDDYGSAVFNERDKEEKLNLKKALKEFSDNKPNPKHGVILDAEEVQELKSQLTTLKEENERLQEENRNLKSILKDYDTGEDERITKTLRQK